MSQRPIREYDAKTMFSDFTGVPSGGFLITSEEEITSLPALLEKEGGKSRVVKPDQLFGKRGIHGLVGINLTAQQVKERLQDHGEKEVTIDGKIGVLDTFLIEPFIAHTEEYYVAFQTMRETDRIIFSTQGGGHIEQQRESVKTVDVPVLEQLNDNHLNRLLGNVEMKKGGNEEAIKKLIRELFDFFRTYGFTYLEINPFCFDAAGQLHLLDMVAKVDTCEGYRQLQHRKDIAWVKPFGTIQHPAETLIEQIDEKTGASLKLTIINPEGKYRFLLGGGGASVIVMDTMANKGLLPEVANYGELSGNPDEDSNRAYVMTLIETMLANGNSDQYLCLVGGIANFTDIVALVTPFTDVLKQYADELRARRTMILMRRGGLRVEQAMQLLEKTCQELGLLYTILDDEHPLTEIFDEVHL